MTIQRQYSLPNCTLVLQGLGDPTILTSTEARPRMSTLISAECHLASQDQPLSGGREFFESLVVAVSQYAQEILSGIHRSEGSSGQSHPLVRLQRLDASHHRLSVQYPDGATGQSLVSQPTPQSLDLSTVELFDLVEAVDQFLADSQTLPELTLKPFDTLKPLARRYVRGSSESVAKQALPASLGVAGLALAGLTLFFVPVPKVNQPADLTLRSGSTTTSSSPTPTAPPTTAGSSPKPTATASPTASPASPDLARLESVLTTAPEITDPAELAALKQKLYDQVNQAWKDRQGLTQDLVYRVGVGKDGAIVGYKPVNPAALENAKRTPLLDLLYLPAAGSRPESDPIAQFKVVFTPSGVLDVAPWTEAMATPAGGTADEITDVEELKQLQPKLYDQIDQNWKTNPPFKEDLVFRVRVRQDGQIADYLPDNQAAIDYAQEIPLPSLGKLAVDGGEPPQERLAWFKVVFKPDGKLEVSPWRGRPSE